MCPNSGEAVFPNIIAPSLFSFFTTGASNSDLMGRLDVNEPLVVGNFLVTIKSLILIGIPSKIPFAVLLYILEEEDPAW